MIFLTFQLHTENVPMKCATNCTSVLVLLYASVQQFFMNLARIQPAKDVPILILNYKKFRLILFFMKMANSKK